MEIVLDAEASAEEVAAIHDSFQRAGFAEVEVQTNYIRKAIDPSSLPWVVIISTSVTAFAVTFAKKGAEASVDGLRRLITDVYESRQSRRSGTILLEHQETRTCFVLHRDLPDVALVQLLALDADACDDGETLMWDEEEQDWAPPS